MQIRKNNKYNITEFNKYGIYVGYFILGAAISLWAILVPFVKERLLLNDAQLGAMLLCVGIGSITAMFFSGFLTAKYGCKKTALFSSIILLIDLIILSICPYLFPMVISLFIFGSSMGVLDVSLNLQSVLVEDALKRNLMAGFHSTYSVACSLSSFISAYILSVIKFNPVELLLILVPLMLITVILLRNSFIPIVTTSQSAKFFEKPNLIVLLIGFMIFITYLSEGAILDWSAILMMETKNIPKEYAGYALSLFYLAMTVVRFFGKYIAEQFHRVTILTISSIIMALGILIIINLSNKIGVFIGFLVAGIGISNIIPTVMSSISKFKGDMPLNLAVSTITTIGYSGILLGPAIMGFITHSISINFAFYIIICIILMISILSPILK